MTIIIMQLEPMPDGTLPWPVSLRLEPVDEVLRLIVDHGQPDAAQLLGFQNNKRKQVVNLWAEAFAEQPELAVGKYPVYLGHDGGMFTIILKVTDATLKGED